MIKTIELSEREKKILGVLCFSAVNGNCRLMNWEIARLARVKCYVVAAALKELERKGIITRKTRTASPPLWARDQRITAERVIEIREKIGEKI